MARVTPGLRRTLSHAVGWLADRRIPRPLRSPVYRAYAGLTGADPSEARLALTEFPSLGAFFVRRLKDGARTIDPRADRMVSPCDGVIQALGRVEAGKLLQAKGRDYTADELLAGAAEVDEVELEGARSWTIYLGPKDYHRVHAPLAGDLVDVRWVPGDRLSVAPKVLARRERVFASNERAVLSFRTAGRPWFLVMVGALNVGRIRVVGVEPGTAPGSPKPFEKGAELARFEMGSTVVLVVPNDLVVPEEDVAEGDVVRLGTALGVAR